MEHDPQSEDVFCLSLRVVKACQHYREARVLRDRKSAIQRKNPDHHEPLDLMDIDHDRCLSVVVFD